MNRAHKTLAGEEGSFRFGLEYRNRDATNRAGIIDQFTWVKSPVFLISEADSSPNKPMVQSGLSMRK